MNDIEILKEHCVETHNTHKICFTYNDEERIWSLIQRNKDLEQIEKEHKEENGRLREENINLKEKIIRQQEQLNIANKKILAQRGQLKVVNNSYIPISKVKEKMQELDKEEKEAQESISDEEREEYSDASIGYLLMNIETRRNVLQELLEESDK